MITEEMVRVALRAYNEDCNGCTAQAPALRRAITAALAAMWQDQQIALECRWQRTSPLPA